VSKISLALSALMFYFSDSIVNYEWITFFRMHFCDLNTFNFWTTAATTDPLYVTIFKSTPNRKNIENRKFLSGYKYTTTILFHNIFTQINLIVSNNNCNLNNEELFWFIIYFNELFNLYSTFVYMFKFTITNKIFQNIHNS